VARIQVPGILGLFFQYLLYCGNNIMSATPGFQNHAQAFRIPANGGVASVQSRYFFATVTFFHWPTYPLPHATKAWRAAIC